MNADAIWSWALKVGVPLVTLGLMALAAWWIKNQGNKTILQKVLVQVATIFQGLASDVTSGMAQAISDATADGAVTAGERAQLVEKLFKLFKTSATARLLSTLESVVGLSAGSALDTWLRGLAADHIDAQLTSASPLKAPSAVASAALASAAPVYAGATSPK